MKIKLRLRLTESFMVLAIGSEAGHYDVLSSSKGVRFVGILASPRSRGSSAIPASFPRDFPFQLRVLNRNDSFTLLFLWKSRCRIALPCHLHWWFPLPPPSPTRGRSLSSPFQSHTSVVKFFLFFILSSVSKKEVNQSPATKIAFFLVHCRIFTFIYFSRMLFIHIILIEFNNWPS